MIDQHKGLTSPDGITYRLVPLEWIIPNPENYNQHPREQIEALKADFKRFGQVKPYVVKQLSETQFMLSAGEGCTIAAAELLQEDAKRYEHLGWAKIVVVPDSWTNDDVIGFMAADNETARMSVPDEERLIHILQRQKEAGYDLRSLGSDEEALRQMLANHEEEWVTQDEEIAPQEHMSLADRFIIPPFSVLDARQGYWQERKHAWIALGIQSELGRGESSLDFSASCVGLTKPEDRAAWHATRRGDPKRMGATPMPDGHGGLSDQLAHRSKNGKSPGRSNGQDLMRGEHTVGQGKAAALPPSPGGELLIDRYRRESGERGKRLTWVAGEREEDELDEVSRKNLAAQPQSGTSIFDPVLCELAYRWFSPPAGTVLDPFAGGSVRGIVAAKTGRQYIGIDLSQAQIAANEQQAQAILNDEPQPCWIVGDSRNIDTLCPDVQADLVFTCPPYYDLEVYSDDQADLSTAFSYDDFLLSYRAIMKHAIAKLKDNRFVCIVVGDIRDKKGFYRNFVGDTIATCQNAGARLYNEAILVTSVGSLPIRVGKQFSSGRKLGKTHQNVLVFCKGDPLQAVRDCGPVVVNVPEEEEYASLSTQAPQEATATDSTQALQPAHESATSEEES